MFNMGRGPDAQSAELEQLARRYWDTWREALQRTMPGGGDWAASAASAMPGMPGMQGGADPWREAMRWWTPEAAPQQPGMDAFKQLQAMTGPWLERIQQVASQFAGRDASPKAIAGAWREAMGANPLGQMFASMQGQGVEGWDAWLKRLQPWLDGANGGGGRDAFSLPTFGLMREHQERWQQSARAFADYQQSQQGFQSLLMQASHGAFGIFERKLGSRDPATPIETPRALFDLWIDAAEEGYAEIALSPAFRKAYADMVGGQMRLRQAVQREVEQACRALDLPTRTELDGAHRKIADLERNLRRLRDRLDAMDDRDDRNSIDDRGGRPSAASAASSELRRHPAGPTRGVKAPVDEAAPSRAPERVRKSPARKTASAARSRLPANGVVAKPAIKKSSKPQDAAGRPGTKRAPARSATKQRPASKAATRKATKRQAAATPGTATSRAGTGGAAKRATTSAARSATSSRSPGRKTAGTPARAARDAARPSSRVGSLPNLGFISPIPQTPTPLQGKGGTPRKGKR